MQIILIRKLTIGSNMINECNISNENIKDIYKIIGKNVKKYREEKGVSQLALSLAIGHKSVGVISNCELCLQNKHFNIEHLVKISNALEVNIEYFFKGIRY